MTGARRAAALVALSILAVDIDGQEAPSTTVGMEGRLEILLPESGLTAKAPERRAPLLVRVAGARPHGTLTSYDLRYIGHVPGRYDLRDYLLTADGRPAGGGPAAPVTITGVLPMPHNGWLEERPLRGFSLLARYRSVAVAVVTLWLLAFFVILRMGRRPAAAAVEAAGAKPPTFAERLRPLVERAAAGELSADGQATLERMLIAYWQRRLGLGGVEGEELIARLREHPEAGALLRTLEDWLHRPPGSRTVAVEPVLAPYRDLPSDEPARRAP